MMFEIDNNGKRDCGVYQVVGKESPSLKVKKLVPEAMLPRYASADASGFDISSVENVSILPNSWKVIKTGLSFEIPKGYEIQIRSRSGLAAKKGVVVLNSPGTIDSDYINELMIILFNHGLESFVVNVGDRIAQGVFASVSYVDITEIAELSQSAISRDRGGGLGSTGV